VAEELMIFTDYPPTSWYNIPQQPRFWLALWCILRQL